jgi:hypothetical protein
MESLEFGGKFLGTKHSLKQNPKQVLGPWMDPEVSTLNVSLHVGS